jgi:iron complex transport system substrate-binding protein
LKKYLLLLLFLILCAADAIYAEYKRIISLAPSVTANLYELGLESKVVGITQYCPKGTTPKEVIGTLQEPNIEKIISLRPDIIISTKEGNKRQTVEKLQSLNLEVYTMETAANFDEIASNALALAEKTGSVNIAKANIAKAKEALNETQKQKLPPSLKVFWVIGAAPLVSAGGKSIVNDYQQFIGGYNIFNYVNARYPSINAEAVLQKNPDVILLVDMGDVSKKEIKYWQRYKTLSAVKNKKIFMVSPDIFTLTPLTFAESAEILRKTINDKK